MKANKDILNLANKLANDKWLILPTVHKTMLEQVNRFLETGKYPEGYGDAEAHEQDKPFDDAIEAAGDEEPTVAIVEVNGVLMKHPSLLDQMFGAMDIDSIHAALQDAANDESVSSIVMWFNSPGGTTTGIEELGRYISQCPKPTVAFTDSMMASAAYWLGSQCDEVVLTPSACVGSVGVFALVLNDEKAMADAGIRVDAIYSGKYKLMGHTFHTLTTDERKILQDDVDKQHETFKNTILSRRPEISVADMEGLTYEGAVAVEKHYADATVDSIDELLEEIGTTMKNEKEASAAKAVPKMETAPAVVATPTVVAKTAKVEVKAEEEDKKIPGLPGVNEDAPVNPKDKDRDADEDGQKQDPAREKYQEEEEGESCPHCGRKMKKAKHAEEEDDKEEPEKEDGKKADYKDGEPDKKSEEEDDKEPDEDDTNKKMSAPTLTTQAWRDAISGLKVDHGQMTMTKESNNLQGWRAAQEAFRNQKS